MFKFRLSVIPLLLANLLPVMGVMYWGWSLAVLLIIYWLEGLIVGVFTLAKMAFSSGSGKEKIGSMVFFCFHYGLFWLAHGLFLFVFVIPLVKGDSKIANHAINTDLSLPVTGVLAALFASHFLSFMTNFMGDPRARDLPPAVIMFLPYGRVFVMHILIIGSAIFAVKLGGSAFILILFIGLKIIVDMLSHMATNDLYTRIGKRPLSIKS